MTVISLIDVHQLINAAERLRTAESTPGDPMTLAASHLIGCAVDAVTSLPGRDPVAAQKILDSARAAAAIAAYAVREIDGDARRSS